MKQRYFNKKQWVDAREVFMSFNEFYNECKELGFVSPSDPFDYSTLDGIYHDVVLNHYICSKAQLKRFNRMEPDLPF